MSKRSTALRVITNSELKTHRRCACEHHIAYELGYRSVRQDAQALRFGTAIHLALAAWWSASRAERLAAAFAALPADMDLYDLARAVEMLRGYDARWCDEPLELITLPTGQSLVETEFRTPLLNPATGAASRTFELGGKLDALVLNTEDGRPYILEHKSSGQNISAGSVYWQLLQLDTQVSTYYAGARAMGFDPAGVIYDVLGKPKQKPHTATPEDKRKYTAEGRLYLYQRDTDETPDDYGARVRVAIAADPDHYFVRGTVVRLEREERDAQYDTWQQAQLIRDNAQAKRWPRNPDSCERYGRMCAYFALCTGTATLEDQTQFQHVDNVHPELTPPEGSSHDTATGSTTPTPDSRTTH